MCRLLIVGLVDARHQTQMLPLRSRLSWWAVPGAAAASLVVVLPRIQRFLFVFDVALVAAHLFDAMTALGGLSWWERLLRGSFLLFIWYCFNLGRRRLMPRDELNASK